MNKRLTVTLRAEFLEPRTLFSLNSPVSATGVAPTIGDDHWAPGGADGGNVYHEFQETSNDDFVTSTLDNSNCSVYPKGGKSRQPACTAATAGDANLDGQFDQRDVAVVFRAARYLTGQTAAWSEGDWNGDGLFDQADVVAALLGAKAACKNKPVNSGV
jgi:hypothetical protein